MNLTAKDIASRLSDNVEAVCRHLLTQGSVKSGEWTCGSVHGEAGKSCKVVMKGNKAGIWSDFASGQAGDLLDLWAANKSISISEAIKQAKDFLGIKDQENFYTKPSAKFSVPKKPKGLAKLGLPLLKWFHGRGITRDILKKYRVGQLNDKTIVYAHFNDTGKKIISLRFRKLPKEFRNSKDSMPTLWGWHSLSDNARKVVICEGYEDAMSWAEYGYEAMSVPFGAGSGKKQQWIDNDYERLQRFDTIYISMDMDDAGLDCVEEIAERLGRFRCSIVSLPKKDCNDCLLDDVPKKDIDKAIRNAKSSDPKDLRRPEGFLEDTKRLFFPSGEKDEGYQLPWNNSTELRFRPGELILHTGFNGAGKSQWVNYLSILMMASDYRVATASMEFHPKRLLHRMVRQITGIETPTEMYIDKAFDWLDDKFWLFGATGTGKSEQVLETMMYARKRYNVEVFIIDSFMKCGIGEKDIDAQKNFMDKLSDFKNEHECQIHVIAHQRKPESQSPITARASKYGVKGSSTITDLPDTVILIDRNKKKEMQIQKIMSKAKGMQGAEIPAEIKRMPDAFITVDKQRNGSWEGSFALHFDLHNFQYRQWKTDKSVDFIRSSK